MLKLLLTWLLAIFFVAAGTMHFLRPKIYLQIMPPYIPWHLPMIYLTGLWEIFGGLAVLVPALRYPAGISLIVLLVAIFPANIHMAVNNIGGFPPLLLWARLPLQGVLVWWVWYCTKP
ncbi:MAG: hypothetical protein FJX76_11485 [Armatimonadetes bacterium]|nr:hypothetical protein [Armatimonadota bacterium]